MHTTGRHEADQMAGAAALLQSGDQAGQRRRLLDLAGFDGVGDARQVLHHHAARADVEMPHLGIAHLPARQADVETRGVQEGMRRRCPEPVEGRRARLKHGVVGGVFPPSPAVQNRQHHRTPLLHLHLPHHRRNGP